MQVRWPWLVPVLAATIAFAALIARGSARTSASISWGAPGTIATLAGTGTTGPLGDGGPPELATLSWPMREAVNAAGTVVFTDTGTNRVRQIQHGVISTIVGCSPCSGGSAGTETPLSNLAGVAFAPNGDLLIADAGRCQILRYSVGTVSVVAGVQGVCASSPDGPTGTATISPVAVAESPDGDIYFAEQQNWDLAFGQTGCYVRRIHAGMVQTIAGTGSCGYSGDNGPALAAAIWPDDMALDPTTGALYIVGATDARVREISGGVITSVAGTGVPGYSGDGGNATSAQLLGPRSVAVGADGSIFIADAGSERIREVHNGIIQTVAGTSTQDLFGGDGEPATAAALNSPMDAVVDSNGNIYIADLFNNRIRVVFGSGPLDTTTLDPALDSDGDGYPDIRDMQLEKSPYVYCAIARADVNMDGTVTILDLSAAAGWYHNPAAPPRYYQTGSSGGGVGILDLSRMATAYGEHVSSCP